VIQTQADKIKQMAKVIEQLQKQLALKDFLIDELMQPKP
jgi:hypothetical protein